MNALSRSMAPLSAAALLAFLPAAGLGAGRPSLSRSLKALDASPALKNAPWGLSVKDVASGRTLADVRADKSLVPASSLKVFVTAAALAKLGAAYRFRTGLYASGTLAPDGTLRGDLVLKGGGDPAFGSTLVPGSRSAEEVFSSWVSTLAASGIRRVEGSVLADARLFEGSQSPGSWSWEDLGNYYAAQASALSIGDNAYTLVFAPGPREGDPARLLRTEPEVPGLSFVNFMRTGPADSGDNGYVFCVPGQQEAVLRGTLPAGAREYSIKGALPDPALFAAHSFLRHLRSSKISISGGAARAASEADLRGARLLAEELSPPVADIARVTMRRSVNLYAEMLARALALAAGGQGTASRGLTALHDFLFVSGVNPAGLRLSDASGLSRQNAVPPAVFTDFLASVAKSPLFEDFRSLLVTPGADEVTGKVRGFGQGVLDGRLYFKSGFLTGARSYCGYLKDSKGRWLAFAFIVNHHASSRAEVEALLVDVLAAL